MPDDANEFIALHNALHTLLRRKTGLREDADYSSVVSHAKNARLIDAKQKEYLLLVGRLRNAIVHDECYPNEIIAEPHPQTIEKLRQLKAKIENPPTIDNLAKNQPKIFKASDRLLECLQHMHAHDYSQIVVSTGNEHTLITREDIACWFEKQIVQNEILISLEDKTLEEILSVENKDDCKFLQKNAKLADLLAMFETRDREKLAAVLITEHGRPAETPINIFTHYDLPEIIGKLEPM